MKELKQIELEKIRIDGGTQMRAEIDQSTVSDYAERIEEMPPSIAFNDGSSIWLADGFHRYHAHRAAKKTKMLCEVKNGTQRDAILFAIGANSLHGLKRTNADKRRAVETLLNDPEWSKKSANWIAEAAGVGVSFAADMKRSLCAAHSGEVVGRDGRSTSTAGIAESNKSRAATKPDTESDDDEFFPARKTPPKPAVTKDEENQVISNPKLIELYTRRTEISELMSAISKVRSIVRKGCDSNDPLYAHVTSARFDADCGNIFSQLGFARPHAVCPYCGGRSCKVCKKSGFVGKEVYKHFTPEDLKV